MANPILVTKVLPDDFFRWEDVKWSDFTDWAMDPANQTPENFAKAGLFHPLVRQVWIEKGFIIVVDPETPVPGVISSTTVNPEWLDMQDEVCPECMRKNRDEEDECPTYHERLLGGWTYKDRHYEPNESKEYSAVWQEGYIQVVWSSHTARHAYCSPCFPDQGNLEEEGDVLTYTLPPEALENNNDR
jgi:hypothetical protein